MNVERFVKAIFITVITFFVCYLIAVGVIGYMATKSVASQDWSGGLKPVIEKLWCGEPGCIK